MNDNQCINRKMNIPSRKIINRDIYLFIHSLLKNIIYVEDKPEEKTLKEELLKKIDLLIKIANEKIYPQIGNSSNNEERQINPK